MSFTNKVGIVAGAGGGMGLNIANDLIRAGCSVTLADLKAPPDAVCEGPGNGVYQQGDLTDITFVENVVRDTVQQHGRLDYLVNTAGVLWFDRDKSLVEMDMDVWDEIMRINLKSFALTSRCSIPHMRATGGGALVHFSSVDALVGDAAPQDAYGASKAAVIRLSKSLAVQFAPYGIRSNVILPGPVMSPMQERWADREDLQGRVASAIPLGRLGTTQDQTDACLFLLSDKASFITGTELIVDGGITAA